MLTHEDILRMIEIVDEYTASADILEGVLALGMSNAEIRAFAEVYKTSYQQAARVMLVHFVFNPDKETPVIRIDPRWDKQRVIAVKYKRSGSGNMTWLCTLEGGQELYIRQANKQRWLDAGYTALEDMKMGDQWDADIVCYTVEGDKSFLDCQHVVSGGTLAAPAVDEAIQRRKEVVLTATDWVYGLEPYYFLDTETTGKDTRDEVIEIAIIDWEGDVRLNTRVRPTCEISPEARDVHGITDDDLKPYPAINEVSVDGQWLSDWLIEHQGHIVTYGADFDARLINQTYKARGFEAMPFDFKCAMRLYAQFNGEKSLSGDWLWVKLEDACQKMRVDDMPVHSALTDALAALGLIKALAAVETEANSDEPF